MVDLSTQQGRATELQQIKNDLRSITDRIDVIADHKDVWGESSLAMDDAKKDIENSIERLDSISRARL